MKFNSEKSTKHDDSEARARSQDRFDLLSAYLDGEVTSSERQQVQDWLDTDEKFQHQCRQLQRMQQVLNHLSAPSLAAIPADLSMQLFRTIDRQQNRRNWAIVSGLTLFALVTSLLSQFNLSENPLAPNLAKHFSAPAQINPEPLMLALNRPLVEIPTAAE